MIPETRAHTLLVALTLAQLGGVTIDEAARRAGIERESCAAQMREYCRRGYLTRTRDGRRNQPAIYSLTASGARRLALLRQKPRETTGPDFSPLIAAMGH